MVIVDGNRALQTHYLAFTDSRPTYEFQRVATGGIFRYLEQSFERLWNTASEYHLDGTGENEISRTDDRQTTPA